MSGRVFAAAAALAFALAAEFAAAAPALGPEKWRVGPKPNDEGRSIAVEWPRQPEETQYFEALEAALAAKKQKDELEKAGKPVPLDLAQRVRFPLPPSYDYVVSVTGAPGGTFVEVAKVAATDAWKKDATAVFGNAALDATDHFLSFDLRSVVSPKLLARAAFADRKPQGERSPQEEQAIEKVRSVLGQSSIDRAKSLLDSLGARGPEDLDDEAVGPIAAEGYLGTGGLSRIIFERDWLVKLSVRTPEKLEEIGPAKTARPHGALFHTARLNNFILMVLLAVLVLGFIRHAKKNPNLFLRRIGGLDAVDEALGRATEMGKPVLFVHGLDPMGNISTIAAVNILGEIAKKVARFDSKLICVNNDPIVLAVSQETVKEGYLNAGRPDAYNADDVVFVAAEQFSYVAAVDGIMVRQQPAANFYCGYFYAESLLLSETGATTGAIQIAATDAYTQLPFFVTTCDYTLMGEELYAASAYLSRDPLLLGSLKGQDIGKAFMIIVLLLGAVLAAIGARMNVPADQWSHWSHWIANLLKAY